MCVWCDECASVCRYWCVCAHLETREGQCFNLSLPYSLEKGSLTEIWVRLETSNLPISIAETRGQTLLFNMGADIWTEVLTLTLKVLWPIEPSLQPGEFYSSGLLGFTVLVIWQPGNHNHMTEKGWSSCLECHNPFQDLSRRSKWQCEVYQACDSLCHAFLSSVYLESHTSFVFYAWLHLPWGTMSLHLVTFSVPTACSLAIVHSWGKSKQVLPTSNHTLTLKRIGQFILESCMDNCDTEIQIHVTPVPQTPCSNMVTVLFSFYSNKINL